MTDQYLTIATIAGDPTMIQRVAACAAQEGQDEPHYWATQHGYTWAAAPGWGAAWDSATAGGIADPGADPAVITDGQILAQVQGMLA